MFDQDQENEESFFEQDTSVNMEEMKEIAKKIKNYFEKNFDVDAKISEEDDNVIEIKFKDSVEMTPEEYEEEFYNFLKKLGFHADTDWVYPVTESLTYRSYVGAEQFKNHEDTMQILVYFTMVSDKEGTLYFIKKIEVEKVEYEEDEEFDEDEE